MSRVLYPKGVVRGMRVRFRAKGLYLLISAFLCVTSAQPGLSAPFSCVGSTSIPRDIVALYDSRLESAPAQTRLQRYAALPLHHLGYELRFVDIATTLPQFRDVAQIAGIASWFDATVARPDLLADWLSDLDASCGAPLPQVAFGHPGTATPTSLSGQTVLAKLGLLQMPGLIAYSGVNVTVDDQALFGFEADPLPPSGLYDHFVANAGAETLMQIETRFGPVVLASRTPHGLYLHGTAALAEDGRGGAFWIVDPFAAFATFGDTAQWPVPDTTTLNNRRLFLATVTPQNWLSRQSGDAAQTVGPPAHDLLQQNVMQPFADLPLTLAIDMASLAPPAAPAAAGPSVRALQQMIQQPTVLLAAWQGASDTPSRDAAAANAKPPADTLTKALSEIEALVGQRPQAVVWAPGTNPSQTDLDVVAGVNIPAFGGGDSAGATLASLPSPTVPRSGGAQVLFGGWGPTAALWSDPLGLHSLTPWLAWTDMPRRLVPYHVVVSAGAMLDPAARYAVTRALQVGRQPGYIPVSGTHYDAIIAGFSTVHIRPQGALRWDILDRGALQTFRFDAAEELMLDPEASRGVLGEGRHGTALYIALDPAEPRPRIALVPRPFLQDSTATPRPTLIDSGLQLSDLRPLPCGVSVTAQGFAPGQVIWRASPGSVYQAIIQPMPVGEINRLDLVTDPQGRLTLPLPTRPGTPVQVDLQTKC